MSNEDLNRPGSAPRHPRWALLSRHRAGLQLTADAGAWTAAIVFASLARFEFDLSRVEPAMVVTAAVTAVAVQAVAGVSSGLYLGKRRFGSFDEVAVLVRTAAGVTASLVLAGLLMEVVGRSRPVPLSVLLAGGVVAFVFMGAVRYAWRLWLERQLRPSGDEATRLLVYGAGDSAEQIVTAMLRKPDSAYVPVALLDDDPGKKNLRIRGLPVVGTSEAMGEAARCYDAQAVLVAIPSAGSDLVRDISTQARAVGLEVKVLPPVGELIGGQVGVSDIRPLTAADLLGRHEIDTDVDQIAGYLTGRRVLVTGAGGSIGGELCRQIARFGPAELVLADHDESALHAVQLSLSGHAALDAAEVALADVRDTDRLDQVFAAHRPEVVFHAAALKHVTALESHPGEAVKTNIWGTQHVLAAAARHEVACFVNVSTDKAANPANVLGHTKRIAERLTAQVAAETEGTFLSVRFGNVLGSRGSMLSTFQAQIDAGGPVTVTHPEVTRFFMTTEEACQLVIQAGAIGADGQTLVLDMGEPVRIAEVARQLVDQADPTVEIVYTGLRCGEKLHECLFGDDEADVRPAHSLIAHVDVPKMPAAAVRNLDPAQPAEGLTAALATLSTQAVPSLVRPAEG